MIIVVGNVLIFESLPSLTTKVREEIGVVESVEVRVSSTNNKQTTYLLISLPTSTPGSVQDPVFYLGPRVKGS